MPTTNDYMTPGSDAQREAVRGMASHTFGRGGDHDLGAEDIREQAAIAQWDIASASAAYQITQDGGDAVLYANETSGTVAYVNTTTPDKSTYFAPTDGVEKYVSERLARAEEDGELVVDVTEQMHGLTDKAYDHWAHERGEQEQEMSEPELSVESDTPGDDHDGPER